MSPTPRKRSTILVTVGATVFVLGTGLAALATRGSADDSPSSAPQTTTTVVAPAGLVSASTATSIPSSFVIPAGQQAMAVQVPFVAGGAGYAKAGDFVNVYGAYKTLPITANPPDPKAKLVLQKVKVLGVTAPLPGAETGNATYILAVSTSDAEAIVYLSKFQDIWLTLARDDQGTQTPKGFSDDNA